MVTKEFNKILLFGGTYEGRKIAEFCEENQIDIDICVATEYGKEVISHINNKGVFCGRLDENGISELILSKKYDKIIDATHPYATLVTENIKNACIKQNIDYIRVARETSVADYDDIVYFESIEDAVFYLNEFEGIVFSTTGSKELYKYKNLKNLSERLVVRALPFDYSLKNCEEIGVLSKNIILMQGPFDLELNLTMMKKYNSRFIITKLTGKTGGFDEKITAARKLDMKIIVISKPFDNGINLDELKEILRGKYEKQ